MRRVQHNTDFEHPEATTSAAVVMNVMEEEDQSMQSEDTSKTGKDFDLRL